MKLFTNEDKAYQAFSEINDKVTRLQIKEALAGRWFRMAMSVFTTIGPMLVYLVGGYLLTKDQITIGGIVAFATLLTRLYNPVIQLSNIQVDFMRSFALFQRIFDYLDLQPDIADKAKATETTFDTGEIIFNEVNFNYEDEPALRKINLMIPAGKMTALVGSSGAGKSTLTSLITRIQDPSSGTVTIDGYDIKEITLKSLRSQIGVVTQEAYLFNGTIRDNLLYGNENASEAAIIAACKAAYIHDFIMTLPKGYDTEVGNRGIKLSGGEKQRLAIARVILKDPKILILDEATSALDAISERYVQMAMDELLKDRTSIVIAHRLSTIRQADQIIVMNKGQIVEHGSHLDLLKQKGVYYDLHSTQYDRNSA